MRGFLGSLLGLIGLGEEYTYGTGLLDPQDQTKLLHPDWLRHATAEQLNVFTQDHLNAMTREQVEAYQEGINNAIASYDKAVADSKEIERRANLTFPTSLTPAEIDALTPEQRADYYERVQYAPRTVNYNAVATQGRDGAPDWQYSVNFMNGIGALCQIRYRTMGQVRHCQSTLSLAGIGSISQFHPTLCVRDGLGKMIAMKAPAETMYRYGPRTITNLRVITDRRGYNPRSTIQRRPFRFVRYY